MRVLYLIIIAILLSSCATIMNSSANKSAIINSEPSGASVLINGSEVGTTPYTFNLADHPADKHTLMLEMEGYEPLTQDIVTVEKNGYMALDALLLCIPCIFDIKNNKVLEDKEMSYKLYRSIPKYDEKIFAIIDPVETTMRNGEILGKANSTTLKFSKTDNMDQLQWFESYDRSIKSYLNNFYFESMLTKTYERNDYARKPKVRIVPSIEHMSINLKGSSNLKIKGTGTMDVKWDFFNPISKEMIYSTTTSVKAVKNNQADFLIDLLWQEAIRSLVSTDGLYDTLNTKSKSLSMPAGTNLELQAPAFTAAKDKKELFGNLVKGSVTVQTEKGFGSGFFITPDGYILTNYHVIDGMSHITVVTTEGYKLNGTVVKSNIAFDLALLKVDASGVTCLSLGNSEELVLGEEVFAIGTGASEKLNQSISKGIVSGFRTFDDMPYIQTDVAINPGNSGGPLVNELGKVMGIATMKLSGDNLEGIGFCIPISKAIEMLNITFKN